MKYVAIDELSNFQFHDAVIESIYFQDKQMIWVANSVNATTTNTQNEFTEDMCIENAKIIFENVHIESIIWSAYTIHDSNGSLIESKKDMPANSNEYTKILREVVGNFIYGMEKLNVIDDTKYSVCFCISVGVHIFYLTFTFTKSIHLHKTKNTRKKQY